MNHGRVMILLSSIAYFLILSCNEKKAEDVDAGVDVIGSSDADIDIDTDTGAQGIYQWHTFYGPTGEEMVIADIITDNDNKIYVAGASYESWKGPYGQEPLHEFSGDSFYRDVFILKLK